MGILNIENVSKSFGSRRVLDSVSLSLERGETLALIGPSGEGKSTLLRICALLERADSGAVEYDGLYACKDGHYAGKAELTACRARLGMVFQSFELFPHRSVIQNICDAPVVVQHRNANEVRQEGSALLARVGLAGREDAMPYQQSTLDVLNIIRSLKSDGISMMIVTHEMAFAKSAADRIAFLYGGRIAEIGTGEYMFGKSTSKELEKFLTGGKA